MNEGRSFNAWYKLSNWQKDGISEMKRNDKLVWRYKTCWNLISNPFSLQKWSRWRFRVGKNSSCWTWYCNLTEITNPVRDLNNLCRDNVCCFILDPQKAVRSAKYIIYVFTIMCLMLKFTFPIQNALTTNTFVIPTLIFQFRETWFPSHPEQVLGENLKMVSARTAC